MSLRATDIRLREALPQDAGPMAGVLLAAWRAGYAGIVPDDIINERDLTAWQEILEAPVADGVLTTVAVDEDDRVVGFTRFGPDPDDPSPSLGYIASVYVDPDAAGAGIGRRLVERATEELASQGRHEVTLWVFRDNARARALYERLGFAFDGDEYVDALWRTPQVRYRRSEPASVAETDAGGAPRPANADVIQVASPTEERNPLTADIDVLPVVQLLQRINDEDGRVAGAVRDALPKLAELVEVTVERLANGGRVHYFGAGSSGRLGLLDAAELPPTFGVPAELFEAHLAGGDRAVRHACEGAEDDELRGQRDAGSVTTMDVVIGLASSGYTPYVGAALRHARAKGAHTALVTSNSAAPLADLADTLIYVDTGPEVITGSTRLKSGTAQKLVLNSFSTAVMVQTGRTWSNLMVDLVPSNAKLRGRVVRLLMQASENDEATCESALIRSGQEPKTALVTLLKGVSVERARSALEVGGGRVAAALEAIENS
jgi:N-acetylmuramic acid 6-phosphate etherase